MHEETKMAVLDWFKCWCDQNLPVSGPLPLAKAEEFQLDLVTDFNCSTGVLDIFKERRGDMVLNVLQLAWQIQRMTWYY